MRGQAEGREPVEFLTLERGVDLIVSFAISGSESGEVISLSLIRTSKYEPLLPEEERGVWVSHESYPEHDRDYLRSIVRHGSTVTIVTNKARYELDVSSVEASELRRARRILDRMNFDRRFEVEW